MPEWIVDLYLIHLADHKTSRHAFDRFYDANNSRIFVQRYAIRGKRFYSDFMSRYLKEIRERPEFSGIIIHRGVMR